MRGEQNIRNEWHSVRVVGKYNGRSSLEADGRLEGKGLHVVNLLLLLLPGIQNKM